MLQKIKQIHPGWFIGGFFAILIGFNIAFFAIAASQDVKMVPRQTAPAATQPAAADAPGADAAADAAPAPIRPTLTR